jgi:hypothetical protein
MRAVIKFVLGLILVLAVAWVGLWWYAEGRLQNGFEAWADTQAAAGWKITYTALNRGTSPMQALVTVTNLTLTPPPDAAGETGTITLPGLALRIDALNPLVFHTDLPNKISVAVGDNIGLAINSSSIALSENLDPNALFNKSIYPFRGGDFSAGNVDVLASEGSLLVLHIDSITSHADLNLAAGAADTAMATTTSFNGIALSPLFTKVAQIPFNGQVSNLSLGLILSGPVPGDLHALAAQISAAAAGDEVAQQKIIIPVVRKWASQGGSGSISLGFTIGPSTAKADAAVKFDANLQPSGTADLSADHLDEFTAAITSAYPQVQDTISQAEAQLTPYLTTTATGGQTLGMTATYGPPGVTINGTKVADMPPVNWDALENPPPAPPAAPGDDSGAAAPATQ